MQFNCVSHFLDLRPFLPGLMNHSRVTSEDWEGRFRCFAYQGIFDGFHLSQSGEATCNLYSAKEGDRTMTLKKGNWLMSSLTCISRGEISEQFFLTERGVGHITFKEVETSI